MPNNNKIPFRMVDEKSVKKTPKTGSRQNGRVLPYISLKPGVKLTETIGDEDSSI
jgi:hypothetical protein